MMIELTEPPLSALSNHTSTLSLTIPPPSLHLFLSHNTLSSSFYHILYHQGIITGISGGSTFKIAMDIAQSHGHPGQNILCMLPDTAERYMSSPLFERVEEDMDEEELQISESTPNYHIDAVPEEI